MKKGLNIFIPIALISLMIFGNGCKKVMEKTPDGRLSVDDILLDYTSTKGLLTSAYSQMILVRDNLFPWQTLEALSDNAFEAREDGYSSYWWNTGQLSTTFECTWPSLGYSGTIGNDWWRIFWRGIRLANVAIENIPKSTKVNDLEKNQWVNQAKLLRAYYYFQVLEYYGPMPFFDTPFTANFAGWQDLKRPTYDLIARKIASECDDVIKSGFLPVKRLTFEKNLLSAGFAYALKSRVLLYNASPLNNPTNDIAKWQVAADAAKGLLDIGQYSLVNMQNYRDLFVSSWGADIPEIIYSSPANDVMYLCYSNGVSLGSYGLTNSLKAGEVPSQELVDCFEMKNGALPITYNGETHTDVTINPAAAQVGYSEAPGADPYQNRDERFYQDILYNGADFGVPTGVLFHAIIDTYVGGGQGFSDNVTVANQQSTTTGYYTRKYRDVKWYGPSSGWNAGEGYMVIFRLAEAYLNYAEAECELGNLAEAKIALNIIRVRALQPKIEDVPGFQDTKEYILERIRNERRVEFCFEDVRFFDQRRLKVLAATGKVITGMKITKDAGGVFNYNRVITYHKLSYTDKYLVLPIPQDEAKKISGIVQPDAWR